MPLPFLQVVLRLSEAARSLPDAKIICINHWYHHAAVATSSRAVTSGLQHVTFQPMLVKLLTDLPQSVLPQFTFAEDDEFGWRVHKQYGDAAVIKLRYLIGKFDVGHATGGLQSEGVRVAKRRQAEEAEQLVGEYPESFELKCTSKAKGRLGGVRARLRVDVNAQGSVRIGDELAGKVIERAMRD